MTPLVPIMMFGWVPVVLVLFAMLPSRIAVIVAFLGAWLFLPIIAYPIPGAPDYSKASATSVGVLLAAVLFDAARLMRFRPHLLDAPMVTWCLVPMASSVLNGYGPYDGLSGVFQQTVTWGIPYFIGRLYFDDLRSIRLLVTAVVIGGLLYVPLVLIEARLSPQLHTWVYGFHQHSFGQTRRMGGWRPTVFMHHGLAVAMFMASAALAAYALWLWGSVSRVMKLPLPAVVIILVAAALICRSAYAMVLLAGGLSLLTILRMARWRLPFTATLVIPIAYMALRTVGGWDGVELLDAARFFGGDRVESLETRLNSETILWGLVSGDPWFGAGRWTWDRNVAGRAPLIPDGLWIIALGRYGLVGLAAITAVLLLPSFMLLKRFPPRVWASPLMGAPICVALLVSLHMFDSLLNADPNPIIWLLAGSLASLVSARRGTPVSLAPPSPAAARVSVERRVE